MNAEALSSESAVEDFIVRLSTPTELESWAKVPISREGRKRDERSQGSRRGRPWMLR